MDAVAGFWKDTWESGQSLRIDYETEMKLKDALTLLAVPCFLLFGCSPNSPPPSSVGNSTNVLLIVVDTLRADYLSSYGSQTVKTPNMDRLAAQGVRFSNAFSHIPITGPSHSALFTAHYPSDVGVRNNGQVLSASRTCLAETLLESGRTTAGFISLGVLETGFGFEQGFQVYRDDLGDAWQADARQINAKVIDWLNEKPSGPFFAFVHYCDPHEPYFAHGKRETRVEAKLGEETLGTVDIAKASLLSVSLEVPPGNTELSLLCEREFRLRAATLEPGGASVRYQPSRGWRQDELGFSIAKEGTLLLRNESDQKRTIDLNLYVTEILTLEESIESYISEVEFVDRAIGELLETLNEKGLLENTLTILTSDHGEGLGDHGEIGHIKQLYDSMVHVPLILQHPESLPVGTVVDAPVSLVDLFPTICDTLNLPPPPGGPGRSLLPLIDGGEVEGEGFVYLETYSPEAPLDKIGIRTGKWKYIQTPATGEEELYYVIEDSKELHNRVGSSTDEVNSFRAILQKLGKTGSTDARPSPSALDEETRQRLRSLGYFH